MRDAFVRALAAAAVADSSVVLVTGDIGFGVLEGFAESFGDRFINVGVAEQNLAGIAAGMALTGHHVFTYSIGNFPTLRCLEQLRNDICYHDLNVTVVAVGGGMAYGALGPSHFAIEDLAILRSLPGMAVVAPGDPLEVEALVPQIVERGGPTYLRLGRAGEPSVHALGTRVEFGRPTVVRAGADACVLTTGGMLSVGAEAVDSLARDHGLKCSLASVHTVAPMHLDTLDAVMDGHDLIVTCEEHTVVGGLGGAVAEHLAESGCVRRLVRFGLPSRCPQGIGSQEYLRRRNGLDADTLSKRVVKELERASACPTTPI